MTTWSTTKPSWSLTQIIDNLNRNNVNWSKRTLTYRFASGISSAQQASIQRALQGWTRVANLTFSKTTSTAADITFETNSSVTVARAIWWYSGSSITKATVQFNPSYWENLKTEIGGAFQGIMVHEIGHTLGFQHPGNYDGTAVESQRLYQQDSLQYTVMSYFNHPASAIGFSRPSAPLLHDIAAVQKVYGKRTNYNNTDTIYKWDNTGKAFQAAIWDTGGTDTIDASNHSTSTRPAIIDLRAGKFSTIGGNSKGRYLYNVAIAYGVTIENAKGGAGNDTFYANTANNNLTGGGGKDTYVFAGSSWGKNVVKDTGGVLRFDDSTLSQITKTRSGSDLIIRRGTSSVTVKYYYSYPGQWTIKTKSVSADDYAASTSTTGRVNVGGYATGDIEKSGDKDWFRVSLVRGHRYRFDLTGIANPNVSLRLRNSSGSSLASNDDVSSTNRNSRIYYTANYSGYHYLEAGGSGTNIGTYKLAVGELADDFTSTTSTTGRLTVGGTSRGNIEVAGDTDWFRVYLAKGTKYQFTLYGDTNPDVTLRLRDNSGSSLAFNDDIAYPTNLNARIVYTADRTGYYYLDAGAYGWSTGTYSLTTKQVSSSSAQSGSVTDMMRMASKAAVLQQNLVFNSQWSPDPLRHAAATPLSAAFEKDWQKNLLAFSRT